MSSLTNKLPKNARPSSPSSGQWDSVGAGGYTKHQLKQATRPVELPFQPKDRTVSKPLADGKFDPSEISHSHDYEGSSAQNTTKSNGDIFSKSPLIIQQCQTIFFAQNIDPPSFSTELPIPGARYESTAQLALCNDLLRRHLVTTTSTTTTASPLDPVQQALVQPFLQNEEEPKHVFELTRKVVDEFIAAPKSAESISEVVLLVPGLEQYDYRRLLNSLIVELEDATLLSTELLQGIVHMIECAGPFYLMADNLIRILVVLRTRLKGTHRQSNNYAYYLVLAISRILDVMVEGKVKDMSGVMEHESLSTFLTELSAHPDMRLKHEASYALQGLLHISTDQSRRDFVLQHAGNITMGLLGVASVCKLNVGEVQDGVEQLFKVAAELQDVGSKVVAGVMSLQVSSGDLGKSIKNSILSGGHQVWYAALREAQEHIQKGQLADFNHLVFRAPCSRQAEFQWGICQLLAEIAIDPLWNVITRQYAVDFLAQLYKLESIRNPDVAIDRRILDFLRQVVDLRDSPTSSYAKLHLKALENHGTKFKQRLYRNVLAGPLQPYLPKARLSDLPFSPILHRVQGVPKIDRDLFMLRTARLQESANALYVPPLAKPTAKSANDALFPLMEKTIEFCDGPRQVLLLLGDSGGGKSTFSSQLEHTLWQNYKRGNPIPLHINLPTIHDPFDNMIPKRLRQLNFSDDQIDELRQKRRFIVICDGYDECQLKNNLYTANLFNQRGQWQVKLVITSRTQYLGNHYRPRFLPNIERQQQRWQQEVDLFQEAFIAPFSRDQVKEYVERYVQVESTSTVVKQPEGSTDEAKENVEGIVRSDSTSTFDGQSKWTVDDYMDKLSTIHGLMELVSNPFLLSLAVGALPKTIWSENDISYIQLTSVRLYDTLTEQSLMKVQRQVQDRVLTLEQQSLFECLCDEGFVEQGIVFQKKLAAAIFEHQKGNPVVEYIHSNEKNSWKVEFFSPDPYPALLRELSPLIRSGNQHSFIHRSILEYLYARSISDPVDMVEDQSGSRSESVEFRHALVCHPLNRSSVAEEPSILQFLAERVDSDYPFKKLLLDAVESSKMDDRVIQAAANAMSILVKAGVSFHGVDLSGIKIPGALLRGGLFDSADLRGADLTGVNLSKAWLRKANLSGAIMGGIEFGELPHLQLDSGIKSCVFSLDGKLLFVCGHQCSINVYDTTAWELKYKLVGKSAIAISPCGQEYANATLYNNADVVNIEEGEVELVLSGHTDSIESICYSPDGSFIATGSKDKTVRIWRPADYDTVDTVGALRVLRGHDHTITGVAFSPSGHRFASCSMDKTIRIINFEKWSLIIVLDCAAPVLALAYSPNGQQLASCGQCADLRLWDTNSYNTDHLLLKGHIGTVFGVAYSPDGRQVASCGSDGAVRLWNSDSGDLFDSLPGDRYEATCIAFPPTDNLVVSGGRDTRLRMWKTGDEPSANTLNNGFVNRVNCVDISMDGERIATGCFGGAVQLWDTLTGKPGVMLEGHESDVIGVAFSPNGEQVASSSADSTARLWCVLTGQLLRVFEGQAKFGKGLAFALDGTRLATSYENDPAIQLWDTWSGDTMVTLLGHTDMIFGIIYSPSGDQIASWSGDKIIRLWSISTEKCLHILEHLDAILNVAYSHDGKHLISSTAGGSSWWNTQSGEPIEHFWRPIAPVIFWCSYSSDGKYLATVEVEKNRFHLWDISTADCDQGGTEIFSTGIGLALRHVWRKCSYNGNMVLASIDTNFSLRVRELTEDVSGKGSKGSYNDLRLMWSVSEDELSMEDAILDNLGGVSAANLLLMKQRAEGVEKVEWSDGSTEKYFTKWGYFDSDDEEEEEEKVPGKEKDENETEKKDEKMVNKDEKRVTVTMKEPDGNTSDSGMTRELKRPAGTIKQAANDIQPEIIPRMPPTRRASTIPREATIQRVRSMPQESSIESEEGAIREEACNSRR